MKDGKIIVLSAPSGSGKTTLVKHLLNNNSNLEFSISATSRPPRGNEINGKDYHFFKKESFIEAINEKSFIEYEEVYQGIYYGTLKSELFKIWNNKKIAVFDIDVEGGINIAVPWRWLRGVNDIVMLRWFPPTPIPMNS